MSAPAMAEIAIPPEGFAYGEDGAAAVYSPRAEEAVSARPEAGAISTKDGAVTIEFGSGNLAKYEVLRAIGKGKFSTVYRARVKETGQNVALKKIQIFDMVDEKSREKCLKEIKLVKSLDHPNIIQYHDAFIEDNELLLVFEYAEAGDLKRQLRKALEREARFDERVIWKYFSQIADAVQHMHQRRVMHRDLKPANIFLTLNGTVKVGDLGLGRSFSDATMEAYSKVGTPLYMSPEVLKGKGYEFKSDVWSLGCILYELAMLRSPFKEEGLNLYSLFGKITKGDFPPISEVYSKELRDLVDRMLLTDPTQRIDIDDVCTIAMEMRIYTTKLRDEAVAREQASRAGITDTPAVTQPTPAPFTPSVTPALRPPQPSVPLADVAVSHPLQVPMIRVPDMREPAPPFMSTPVMERVAIMEGQPSSKALEGGKILFPPSAEGSPRGGEKGPVIAKPSGEPSPRAERGPVLAKRFDPAAVEAHLATVEQPDVFKPHNSKPAQRPVTPKLTLNDLGSPAGARKHLPAAPRDDEPTSPEPKPAFDYASRTVPDVATEAPVVNPYVSASDPAPPIISTGLMPSPPRGPKTSAAPLSTSPRQLLEPVNDDDTPHAVAQVPDRRLPARAMDDPVGLSGLEEVPENCLALAYSLNERLQLLDYGTAFCEGYMKGAVTPMPGILFLLQPTDGAKAGYNQFQHFVSLCRWLLEGIGVEVDLGGAEGMKYSSPQITASAIVVALCNAGCPARISQNVSPIALTSGYGPGVLCILSWLVDAALARAGFLFKRPSFMSANDDLETSVYAYSPVKETKEGWHVSDRGGDLGDDGIEELAEAEEGEDDEGFVVEPSSAKREAEDEVLTANLDPVEWKKELERVSEALRRHQKTFGGVGSLYSDWRDRIRNFQTASVDIASATALASNGVIAGSASGAPSSIVDALRKIANECRDALSRVSEAEDRIARDSGLNSLSSSYRELSLRHAELQSQCVTTAEVIAEVSNLHSDASDRLEAVKEQLAAKSDVVSDTGPLQLIRAAIAQVRSEIASMTIRTGIIRQQLDSAQLVKQSEKMRKRGDQPAEEQSEEEG